MEQRLPPEPNISAINGMPSTEDSTKMSRRQLLKYSALRRSRNTSASESAAN